MASMALLHGAPGQTKARSEGERWGKPGRAGMEPGRAGGAGMEPGEEGGQDELERSTRGETQIEQLHLKQVSYRK